MRPWAAICFLLFSVNVLSQDFSKHEISINFTKAPYYKDAVWHESFSLFQFISPLTYKYFIDANSALRVNLHCNTKKEEFSGLHSYENIEASYLSFLVGYERIYREEKLKPVIYGDIGYVAEEYLRERARFDVGSTMKYSAEGVTLKVGAGLRYEHSNQWSIVYSTDIALYSRLMTGRATNDQTGTVVTWNDELLTNAIFNPISNLSINFRF